jgi:hypothetical protein
VLSLFAQSDSATESLRRGDDLAAAGAYRRCRDAGRRAAELCICGLEGALTLARVDKSTAPLDRVEQQLQRLLSEER